MSFKLAKQQIEASMPLEYIKTSLGLAYKAEHKQEFYNVQKKEYDLLFPVNRNMTIYEKSAFDAVSGISEPIYPLVVIDYNDNDAYVTFNDWLEEVEVIEEAVEEITELSEDGLTELIVQKYVPEITRKIREFVPKDSYDAEINGYLKSSKEYEVLMARKAKEQLDGLVTSSHGVNFNADITSIGYMNAVLILALHTIVQELANHDATTNIIVNTILSTEIPWKNADGKISTVRLDTIMDALQKTISTIGEVKTGKTL